jgi:tetratricopeptide (TPR) repeat protein
MKQTIALVLALLLAPLTMSRAAEALLVENGQARAEIVIAEQPQRAVRLAADELQTYVEKISGARLAITTHPTPGFPVQVYVGRSAHTDGLKVTAEGLKDGAYRIASGDHWLVLIGDDTEFTPIEPWAKNNGEIVNGKTQGEWEKIVGAAWGVPGILMYKHQLSVPAAVGRPAAEPAPAKPAHWQLWEYDERGSFNAVNGFLQRLGVRWYLPGELGEVVPAARSIALPQIDETVRPDFSMRRFNFPFAIVGYENALWMMRLRTRNPYGLQDAHGLDRMTARQEIFDAHPDWFALYGGHRRFDLKENNQLCYSNEEFFRATVSYVRAQFDHYKLNAVSIMPPDGYTAICQCPLCAGKDSPERDKRGLLSDYIWDFVNRVAKEVGKTHPNQKVLNCAYGVYSLPPLKIAKLEPNVLVSIVGARKAYNNQPAQQEDSRKLRESWLAKTDNPIINFENYPLTDRGWYLPAFTPHTLGSSINALKGNFLGEDIWLSVRHDFEKAGLGLNGFNVYFSACMYWGGREQEMDAIFREYCRLFYGPGAEEMRAFFEYCEANWQEMEKDKTKVDRALELFAAAQGKTETGSVYGRRMAIMDEFLKSLRSKSAQLGRKRGPVPQLRLVGQAKSKIVIDGKLDDAAWEKCPVASTGQLCELQTGRLPTFGTTVKTAWIGHNLYFAIRCDEHPGEKLNVSATRKDDSALWYGDAIEVLLETEAHSYYQIAVNPAGAVADLDRGASPNAWFNWDSQVEVATDVADDHWTVEMRIPVIEDANDPLHQVVGHHPSTSLPWHVNVCRQRIRERGQEYSALSPTGTDGFHVPLKFATFYDGNSHEFDAAAPDEDFLQGIRVAADLARQGKRTEALAAYRAAAEATSTDVQKSYALEQAAGFARGQRQPELGWQLIARIPINAARKVAWMQALLDQAEAPRVIEQFAQEDIAAWPFWKAGDGYFVRGRAYSITKDGRAAEADFLHALEWTAEPRLRDSIQQHLGRNRETNLNDDNGALAAWHEIIDHAKHVGTAEQYEAVLGIARILTKRRQFEDALATLGRVPLEQAAGVWRGTLLLAQGDTLQAAARPSEARAVYETVIADKTIDERLRKAAAEKLRNENKLSESHNASGRP